jgi:hypothetical protein
VFDVSEEACRKAADSFAIFSRGRMNHCVCAVDGNLIRAFLVLLCSEFQFFFVSVYLTVNLGLLIRTRQPRITELSGSIDIKTYRNRKGCFGILVLAGDAKCAFTFFTCRHPGSTNDAWAITESEGGKILMGDSLPAEARSTKRLPEPYYGVGDEAFVNCTTLLAPYGGTHLDMYAFCYFPSLCLLGHILTSPAILGIWTLSIFTYQLCGSVSNVHLDCTCVDLGREAYGDREKSQD